MGRGHQQHAPLRIFSTETCRHNRRHFYRTTLTWKEPHTITVEPPKTFLPPFTRDHQSLAQGPTQMETCTHKKWPRYSSHISVRRNKCLRRRHLNGWTLVHIEVLVVRLVKESVTTLLTSPGYTYHGLFGQGPTSTCPPVRPENKDGVGLYSSPTSPAPSRHVFEVGTPVNLPQT